MNGYCYICGMYGALEKHHVFHGAYRAKADRMGLTVHLCHRCHNEPPSGVHHSRGADRALKAEFQARVMAAEGWDTARFIQEFGQNYREDD